MPKILQGLKIYSDDRDVLEVLRQEESSHVDTNHLKNAVACVSREYYFQDEKAIENRSLIIPKESISENPIAAVEKTAHELVHLLRFGKIYKKDDVVYIEEGIATKMNHTKLKKLSAQNQALEEAIVQDAAKKGVELLLEYSKEITNSCLMRRMDYSKSSYHSKLYEAHVILLNQLFDDSYFKRLIDESFYRDNLETIARYYNTVMRRESAFDDLNAYYDQMDLAIDDDDTDRAISAVHRIVREIAIFLSNQKIYHY